MISPLKFAADLPLQGRAHIAVSFLFAASTWADELLAPGAPRPRQTPEEKAIAREYRGMVERREKQAEREQQRADEERAQRYDGLTKVACKLVGLQFGPVDVPDVPDGVLALAESEPEPGEEQTMTHQRNWAKDFTREALRQNRTRTEHVIGSNRVSEHLAA